MAEIPIPETMDEKAPGYASQWAARTARHYETVVEHHARIEAKTDAFLAATERQIAALADLKHTALWIAGALIVAGYVIVKVL